MPEEKRCSEAPRRDYSSGKHRIWFRQVCHQKRTRTEDMEVVEGTGLQVVVVMVNTARTANSLPKKRRKSRSTAPKTRSASSSAVSFPFSLGLHPELLHPA